MTRSVALHGPYGTALLSTAIPALDGESLIEAFPEFYKPKRGAIGPGTWAGPPGGGWMSRGHGSVQAALVSSVSWSSARRFDLSSAPVNGAMTAMSAATIRSEAWIEVTRARNPSNGGPARKPV